jgi:uncharacterized protein YqeY
MEISKLKDKIKKDLKEKIKNKENFEANTLRLLLAAILNKEKEKRAILAKKEKLSPKEFEAKSELSNEEIISLISSEIKKRKESIEIFQKGKREDLVLKEKREIEVLAKYLPEKISKEDLEKLIKDAILKLKAVSMKDLGKVMKEVMPKVKGRADGKEVSELVKKFLQK